jgi:AcrR family transcriptional regulator
MSPRSRTIADSEILEATGRALQQVSPAQLTLAAVAAEAGLAPATLLQRFGSKRGLLLAFAKHAGSSVTWEFETAREVSHSPLETLLTVLLGMTRTVATPEALSNSLAFLQLDLRDPEFHRHALDHTHAMRMQIQSLLDAAVEAGELTVSDTARLARAVQVTFNGALVMWAIEREETLAGRLQDELEWLLHPFRTAHA